MGSNPATPTKKPPEKDFLRRGSKKREISYGEKYCSGCSAVRLARQLRELEVAGSNPVSPTKIKTFALKGKGFLLWAYDGYSSPKVRVQEKRIPLYQAGSLIFVHPIRDSSGSEAERRNPVFPTERRDTKTFLFSFPDSDMSHGKRTAIKNCLRNSFCLCISHQGANAIQILIFIFQRQFVYTKADEDKKSFANDFSSFRPRVAAIGKVEKSDAIRGFEKSE